METAKPVDAQASAESSCPMCHDSGALPQSWLAKHRGWVVIGLAAIAGTGLALGQGWVTLAAVAPLLYVLPCAVMMLFCMKGMSGGTQTSQAQNSPPLAPTAGSGGQKLIPEAENQA